MKTRLEWFKTMPEPYRSQAIENEDPNKLNEEIDSLFDALQRGFNWLKSPQGIQYWDQASRGHFPHAVKESNELRITKDRVLEAAERCSTTKEALKILFPEAFEDEDKSVDLSPAFESIGRHTILDEPQILIACGLAPTEELQYKCFYLGSEYNWELRGNFLIPTKK